MKNFVVWTLGAMTLAGVLVGCGKDGGSGASIGRRFGGVAATGAPIAGGLVEIAGCSNTATTDASGLYAISTVGCSSNPHIVKVTDPATGNAYLSVAYSDNSIANITPLSNLAVLQAAGAVTVEGAFAATTTIRNNLAFDKVNNVVNQIEEVLTAAGFSANGFLDTAFTADSTGIDRVLDSVQASVNSLGQATIALSPTLGGVPILTATALSADNTALPTAVSNAVTAAANDSRITSAGTTAALITTARSDVTTVMNTIASLVGSGTQTVSSIHDSATAFGFNETGFLAHGSLSFSGISVVGVCDSSVPNARTCTVPSATGTSFADQAVAATTTGFTWATIGTIADGDMIQVKATTTLSASSGQGSTSYSSFPATYYFERVSGAWVLRGTSVEYNLPKLQHDVKAFLDGVSNMSSTSATSTQVLYDDTSFVAYTVGVGGSFAASATATRELEAGAVGASTSSLFTFDEDSFTVLRVARQGSTSLSGLSYGVVVTNDNTAVDPASRCNFTLGVSDGSAVCADATDHMNADAIVVEGIVNATPAYTSSSTLHGGTPVVTGPVRIVMYKNLANSGDQTPTARWIIRAIYKFDGSVESRKVIKVPGTSSI